MYVFIFSITCKFRKIAAHSAYDMFSWYKYPIVKLVFFWSGNTFLIAPLPDRCLLVPLSIIGKKNETMFMSINRDKTNKRN